MHVPSLKWEDINMDFVLGFPWKCRQNDSIWVIVDYLTKFGNFIPVHSTYYAEKYARLYLKEIVRFHGILSSIISDRGAQFISHFWRSFQKCLGTKVNLSTAFHPQRDGQAERITQIPEYILKACVTAYKGSW